MATTLQRASQFGVEAIVHCGDSLQDNPFCEHGPTLLFERFYGQGKSRRFFACSACRDRKHCSFFQWEDEKNTHGKSIIQNETKANLLQEQSSTVKLLTINDKWCTSCNMGFRAKKSKQHTEHSFVGISEEDLRNPSLILSPKESNKSNAQYFFDEEAGNFLVKTIKKLNYDRVICIGTPRIFELLKIKGISSILLDIDHRYGQFFTTENYLRYNMFNHHFFNTTNGEQILRRFICNGEIEKVLIVVDPPFGGLVNILANTFKKIWKLGPSESIDTMLIFPYFLESHVLQSLPTFRMLDFKIGYTNHPQYNNKNTRGSPVRIFTNIDLSVIELPKDKYRFCKVCKKFVYKENLHCKICNSCTSKDGRTYVHCDKCKSCVKPGRKHCTECNQCLPKDHKCSENLKEKSVCHVCGSNEHKRRDCPQRKSTNTQNGESKPRNKRKLKSKKGKTPKKKIRL